MEHCIASGTSYDVSHKIKIYLLKNCSQPIIYSQIFLQGQKILDTVCIHLAHRLFPETVVLTAE
jgi:hypothetical protein